MKIFLLLFLLVTLFGQILCIGQTKTFSYSENQATYGSQSAYTSFIEVDTTEIDYSEMSKESEKSAQVFSKPTSEVSATSDIVIVYGAVSIPVGDFGSTEGYYAGFAKIGYAFGLDVNLKFAPRLAWTLGINTSVNRFNPEKIFEGTGISTETGYWTSIWVLTGLRFSSAVSSDITLHLIGQIGMLVGYQPEVLLTQGSTRGTFDSAISDSFGYGFGGGISIQEFVLYVRYFGGELEYLMDEREKYIQPTQCLQISVGIAL